MSSLWTPGGEVPVNRQSSDAESEPSAQTDPGPGAGPAGGPDMADLPPEFHDLTPEQQQEFLAAAEQMAAARAQLAAAPPEVVVANHVMGLYELGAIHLSQEQPNIEAARLAIDAMAAVMGATKGRLGEHEETLTGALAQMQMAFVEVSNEQDA